MESKSHLSTRRRIAFAVILSVAFCLLPYALRAQQTPNQKTVLENGRRIFSGSCSMGYCHGLNGAGGGGPKLAGRKFSANYLTKVINEGVPETTMPGFKNNLNPEQLANLIAYVQSLAAANATESTEAPVPQEHIQTSTAKKAEAKPEAAAVAIKPVTITKEDRALMGDASAGRELFFGTNDTTNCRVCHTVAGIGGKIGPDLTGLVGKPAKEILQSITTPHSSVNGKYAALAITLKDGSRFTGVKRDEDQITIRLYDTSSLPPVSRAFLKSDVATTETLKTSAMPTDYGTKYSRKQLLDLVAFLKTTGMEGAAK